MLNKILFVLLVITLIALSVLSVREYQDYRDQKIQEQQVIVAQETQKQIDHDNEIIGLQMEVDRLQAECEKGVVAYGLLSEFEREDVEAPLCNLESKVQFIQ